MRSHTIRSLVSVAAVAATVAFIPCRATAQTVVLDSASHWRLERIWGVPPVVRMKDGKLVPLTPGAGLKGPGHALTFKPDPGKTYELPEWPELPTDWMAPAFDDSAWALHRGAVTVNEIYAMRKAFTPRWNFGMARLRGRFIVRDPAAVGDLKLSLTYQGGVVVYLNGHEVARGDLPDGPVVPGTLPTDYTAPQARRKSEWVRAEGMDRELKAVVIPASKLVPGVNVLAIEAQRAAMPEAMLPSRGKMNHWIPLEIRDVALTASSSTGLVPNAGLPEGLHVWTGEPAYRVNVNELGDRSLAFVQPLRIVACRNGVFSGQAVVFHHKPLGAIRATVSDLAAEHGAVLRADALQLRYADLKREGRAKPWFDPLLEQPPAKIPLASFRNRPHDPWKKFLAVQPVWLTARIPADAKPGTYKGTLTIDIEQQPAQRVPVEVKVHDFVMPDAKDFATFLEMHHSPDTIARHYDVPMWSAEHWALLEKSFELTARAGNKLIFIPLFARARFGNDHGMLQFIRKPASSGADGKTAWAYDFSIIERYIDLALKYFDRNMVIVWHVTEPAHEDQYWRIRGGEPQKQPQVTVVNPDDGSLSLAKAPLYGTDEARDFWKPVYAEIVKLVERKGLTKRALTLGTEQDLGVSKAFLNNLKHWAPEFKWSRCTHPAPPRNMTYPNGLKLGYASDVYGGVLHHGPAQQRNYGWRWRDDETMGVHAHWPRNGLTDDTALSKIQHIVETHIVSSPYGITEYAYAGLAHQGADFWAIAGNDSRTVGGRVGTLIDRFPESIWGSIAIAQGAIAWLVPGPDGALSTTRFEVLCEGIQEANVRACIERALSAPDQRARLGEALATRAERVLDQRFMVLYEHRLMDADSGVNRRRDALLAIAAEVSVALQ